MTKFKRVLSRFLRPKSHKQRRQRGAVTPIANGAVRSGTLNSLRKQSHPEPESTDQNVVQPSTDDVVEVVEGHKDEDKVRDAHLAVGVQTIQPPTDAVLTEVEEAEEHEDRDLQGEYADDDEEDDIPEAFLYDLARKTHHEMIVERLYVAVADDDSEIATLRALHRKRFTHIVRVVFNPLSHNSNITPSSWMVQEISADGAPHELRLTCPALTLCYDGKLTTLQEKQLRAARNYLTQTLPERSDAEHKPPLSPGECEDVRVLVVSPTNRSVDVMAIVVCYMAFVTGGCADQVLGSLQQSTLVRSHWGGDILGRDSLDMVNAVSKQK
ncbi:hypothetical protein JVT61DRAFT_5575 [Boletus reticuloceps]|uniref:Uncharacterized protein n=1 Tax=Boletus reticuloceps TaxID=495285 RepID=A0A8I2YXB7_9AGAM|nr:hypothetical protein JVT61DRAFT_5575 [Boletus reticuloceps]